MALFHRVLIANRGAIACRITRTLRRLGIGVVAVHSEAEPDAPHVLQADAATCLGPAAAEQSYLRSEAIIAAALAQGAQAIHPGYGFLSENAAFVEACEAAGLTFIGPTPEQLRQFGLKHTARELAAAAGVPLVPGSGLLTSLEEAHEIAQLVGYPVMLKATAGGGGIGMRVCTTPAELDAAYEQVRRLGQSHFKSAGIFLERYVDRARHIEVQVFGDGQGRVLALGERDCSAQRRNQKLLEETPAPGLAPATRAALHAAAVRLMESVAYRSAGTVEFMLDAVSGEFFFLEVNTRLQVEHGVTEEVYGVDLVEWMVRLAAGERDFLPQTLSAPRGHSIQARLYAENPAQNFMPCAGELTHVEFAPGVRVDSAVGTGSEVTPYYDPLLAKVIAHGADREEARRKLIAALRASRLDGIETNLDYVRTVLATEPFASGKMTTRALNDFVYRPATIDVLSPGNFTTLQDYPGRLGYWAVGVPPSGPMDALAFRLGNRLLGNAEGCVGLEVTFAGPTLRFNAAARVCVTGAPLALTLDGAAQPCHAPLHVPAGSTLALGAATGAGARSYLLVEGGFDVPEYLGSRATFTLGKFGGHAGRTLRAGDVLHLNATTTAAPAAAAPLPAELQPPLTHAWRIGVLEGPHAAPDFFAPADMEMLYAHPWEVHFQSARTGVRLVGPKPTWTRPDGGEAGLHPSNIHDNAYAIGTIDFTGDMPIILGPDGPSLGGFVCPATIAAAELWKLGQLRPGDTVQFVPVSAALAEHALEHQLAALQTLTANPAATLPAAGSAEAQRESAILFEQPAHGETPALVVRRQGDRYLLVELGPLVLDLDLRFRVHALMQALERRALAGIVDLTPGIRSLQVHYDPRVLPQSTLLAVLREVEATLPANDDLELDSRVVHLPLSWDDPATRAAIAKYMQVVRDDAPWCPSNLEFIRRINGLGSIEDVQRIVFDATWLVLGLGDVYLGAPVATPLDPRHRLVTTKYNPARTWTPENAVGIGGAYLCVYGMEGPGGYQFVGRTVQMWNRHRQTENFIDGKPWLLRFFDQVRFYPAPHDELLTMRRRMLTGGLPLRIEPTTFRLRDYHAFLREIAPEAAAFKARQQAAFDAERARWAAAGEFEKAAATEASAGADDAGDAEQIACPPGAERVDSHLIASVWKVLVEEGAPVAAGETLAILEAMKMETPIVAPRAGRVLTVNCSPAQIVRPGHPLFVIGDDASAA